MACRSTMATASSSRAAMSSLLRAQTSAPSSSQSIRLLATTSSAVKQSSSAAARPARAMPARRFSTSASQLQAPRYRLAQQPSSSPLSPKGSVEEMQAWFRETYPASLHLSDDVLLQAMTHESWDHGMSQAGCNRRLSFLGRRALEMFLAMFISSTPALSSQLASIASIKDTLDTSVIGENVGKSLQLEQIMRWTPAVARGQRGPKETGLFKVRGTTVEAFVGAIYHQHGAAVARAFFNSRIAPRLALPLTQNQEQVRAALESVARESEAFLSASSARPSGTAESQAAVSASSSSSTTTTTTTTTPSSSSSSSTQGQTNLRDAADEPMSKQAPRQIAPHAPLAETTKNGSKAALSELHGALAFS